MFEGTSWLKGLNRFKNIFDRIASDRIAINRGPEPFEPSRIPAEIP